MTKSLVKVNRLARLLAALNVAMLCVILPANAQIVGTVSNCGIGDFVWDHITSVTPGPGGAQITISVATGLLDATSFTAQIVGSTINVTLAGTPRTAQDPQGGYCGTVTVGPLPFGSYQITYYTVSDGATPNLVATKSYVVANKPPIVNAGPNQSVYLGDNVNLSGSVTDDQLPAGAAVTSIWTKVSGPGNVSFGSTAQAVTTAGFDQPGIYALRLTATDTQYNTSSDIQITVKLKYDFARTQGVGETQFSYSVSADGAAQVTIPIWVPPGRQGVQPTLALTYSSRGGNGPLGAGWQLTGLSTITTCRRSPALDGAFGGQYPDKFCLDGQRLVLQGTLAAGEYRTEIESYRKIIANGPSDYPDSFDVYQPDGLIFRYASRMSSDPTIAGSNARLEGIISSCVWGKYIHTGETALDTAKNADVFGGCAVAGVQRRAWMLDKVEDRFGNSIEIDYNSSENLLPAEIRYTYHSTASPTKKIVFVYENRPDARQFSIDGIDYTAKRRLKTINVTGPVTLSDSIYGQPSATLRRYELAYTVHPVTAKSMLTQVKECTVNPLPVAGQLIPFSQQPCKSPLNFGYSGNSISFDDKPFDFVPTNLSLGLNGFRTADVNGDGFDDLLYRTPDLSSVSHSGWNYRLSDGQNFSDEKNTGVPAIPDTGGFGAGFVNLDRNETVDALIPTPASYQIARGNTDGTFTLSNLDTVFAPSVLPTSARIAGIGDLNGDSLPDLFLRNNCLPTGAAGIWCRWAVALNVPQSQSISFGMDAMDFRWSSALCEPTDTGQVTNCPQSQPDDPAFVADIDGNGQNELIVPIRKLDSEMYGRDPSSAYSLEMRALGFPIGTSSTVRHTGLSSKQMPRIFMDVNGDGLSDAVQLDVESGTLSVAMNEGGSYGQPQAAAVSAKAIAAFSLPNNIRIGDFNDDGLEDIYLVSGDILLQSDGQLGFVEKSLQYFPAGDDSCAAASCPGYAHRGWDQTLDFNGDGLIDFVQLREGRTHVLQRVGPFPGLLQQITGGPLTPEVRFDYKSTPDIHTPGTCVYPQNCLRKGMWLVSEVGVKADVSDQTYPAGFNVVHYRYNSGRFDVRGRGWLGFAGRTMVDDQTGTTTTTTYDNISQIADTNTSAYRYPGAFRPIQELTQVDARKPTETAGKIWQSTTNYKYQDQIDPGSCGPCILHSLLTEVRVTQAEATATGQTIGAFVPVKSRLNTYAYNLYGLVTDEVTQAFEGGFSADGTPPATAKVKKLEITRVATQPDSGSWLIRRYDRVTATSTEPARDAVAASLTEPSRPAVPEKVVTRTTQFTWQPGTTAVATIEVEPGSPPDPTLHNVTTFIRDPTGNPTEIKTQADSGNAQTIRAVQIGWDTLDQTFPHQVTNPAIHCRREPGTGINHQSCHDLNARTETLYYHAGLGKLAVRTDVNGLTTVVEYDRFGRTRLIDVPSSADTSIDYAASPDSLLTITSTRASGESSRQFVNRWGRTVRAESSRLNGDMAVVESTYNRLNQLAKQTFPYYEDKNVDSAPGTPLSIIQPPASVEFTYDHLGRIRQRSIVAGRTIHGHASTADTEAWSYDGLVERHTNARAIQSTVESDAASRIVRTATLEPLPTPEAQGFLGVHRPLQHEVETRYEYGPFDVLDAVTDRSGNRIQNQYDRLGRRTDVIDPSSGHSTVKFSGYGEPVFVLTGAGVRTSIDRDLLGRVWSATPTYPGQSSPSTESFVWDTAANGIGKLAEATSPDGIKTTYAYDSLGRLSRQQWDVESGASYAIETVWDSFDRPQYFKYPAVGARQLVLEYHYQAQGQLNAVSNQTTQERYWTLLKEDASGIPVSEQFGASMICNRTLDDQKRLLAIETTIPPFGIATSPIPVQQLSYEYGPGGLISTRHNVPDSDTTTENFDYDYLGRLRHWTVLQKGTTSAQTYGYDDLGNLASMTVESGAGRTVTSKYGPDPTSPLAGPYAVRETDENSSAAIFQYDAGGRQTSGGGRTITWNYFDLPSRIQSANQDITYRYDSLHARTGKQGAGVVTTYIGGAYERHVRASGESYVFNLLIPGRVLGQVTWSKSDQTSLFHPDNLATPETVSDSLPAGTIEKAEYDPFGERRNPSALATPASLPSSRTYGFTGHEADDEFGLINMSGRIYDLQSARFLTPDPIVQAPFSSQSWNRYSYVYNNPVNFIDPSGFQCEDAPNCISNGGGGGSGGAGGPNSGFGESQCGSWFPLACLFNDIGNLFKGSSGPNTPSQPPPGNQQSPTRADATRQGADAGTGWNSGSIPIDSSKFAGTLLSPGDISTLGIDSNSSDVLNPPPPGSSTPRGWSFGFSLEVSTINPFTSGGGGAYGMNPQYVPGYGWDLYVYGTPNNQPSSGWAPGISFTGNAAYGEGAWTGIFESAQGGIGPTSFSQFNSPLTGPDLGYYGISFGGGLSPTFGGLGTTTTNYVSATTWIGESLNDAINYISPILSQGPPGCFGPPGSCGYH
jgi:RHS repeat-associated protein